MRYGTPRLARLYLAVLVVWFVVRPAVRDATWWLYVLNVGTDYLVGSLPLAVLLALPWPRVRWIAAGAALVVAIGFVGNVRAPASGARADGPSLKVMTFNISDDVGSEKPMLAAIRRSDADVICLQEVATWKEFILNRDLAEQYPYRIMETRKEGNLGMGVLSRYPIRLQDQRLPEMGWLGRPMIVSVDWKGTDVTLLNVHAIHALIHNPVLIEGLNKLRLVEAGAVATFVRNEPGPVVLCTDFNATPHSWVYSVLTEVLTDTWREAGFGPGFSWNRLPVWPGAFRIDYVMHNDRLRAVEAKVEPWDGASDHRPVSARLVLNP